MAAIAEADPQQEKALLTFEEFAMLDLDHAADLVEGRIIEMSRNNPAHSRLVSKLCAKIDPYVSGANLGEVYGGDVSIITKRDPDTGRGADVAFVCNETLQNQPPNASALQVAPELIIEVVSPSNSWDEIMAKLTEYFAIGVKHVWIVTPSTKTLQDYTSTVSVTGHSPEDRPMVGCPDILPGFELDLRQVF